MAARKERSSAGVSTWPFCHSVIPRLGACTTFTIQLMSYRAYFKSPGCRVQDAVQDWDSRRTSQGERSNTLIILDKCCKTMLGINRCKSKVSRPQTTASSIHRIPSTWLNRIIILQESFNSFPGSQTTGVQCHLHARASSFAGRFGIGIGCSLDITRESANGTSRCYVERSVAMLAHEKRTWTHIHVLYMPNHSSGFKMLSFQSVP